MYKRLYTFLDNKNIIYYLQFGFRQYYSISPVLINITENIRKAFDTVDHQILVAKLNHYGIRGVSSHWFKSHLSNRNQYISINGYESGLAAISCGVPQRSVLGLLLFLF